MEEKNNITTLEEINAIRYFETERKNVWGLYQKVILDRIISIDPLSNGNYTVILYDGTQREITDETREALIADEVDVLPELEVINE
jgi:hypothetical protein